MGFIKVNIKQITKEVLYWVLRTPFNVAWVTYITNYIKKQNEELFAIRENNLFLTNHTGQKISFEHLLNNINDNTDTKLVTGEPITCETTDTKPLFYSFNDGESFPDRVTGFYKYNDTIVSYKPLEPYVFNDSETYDVNGNIILDDELLVWAFNDIDTATSNGYTIYVDSVDYQGYQGVDENGNPIYTTGSKLDIINKYARQYSVLGVSYKIIEK